MTFCMIGEHTMAVNFSYRAILNLTLDLNGGYFFQNIHISLSQFLNHLEK